MGVSYMLVHGDSEKAYQQGARELTPVGSVESLRSAIDNFRPGIQWQIRGMHCRGIHQHRDPRYYFEILMTSDANGTTTLVQVDRAYREFAIELARRLGLAMFDPQDGDFVAL